MSYPIISGSELDTGGERRVLNPRWKQVTFCKTGENKWPLLDPFYTSRTGIILSGMLSYPLVFRRGWVIPDRKVRMMRRVCFWQFWTVIPIYIGIIGGLGIVLSRKYPLIPDKCCENRPINTGVRAISPKQVRIWRIYHRKQE